MKQSPPLTDLDYIKFYAKKLKENNRYFKQQKDLIDSQFQASKSLFRKKLGTKERFKINARAYLKASNNL
jgi:hypothetical protein